MCTSQAPGYVIWLTLIEYLMHLSMPSFAPQQVKPRIPTFNYWHPNASHLGQWNVWWTWQILKATNWTTIRAQIWRICSPNFYPQRQIGCIHQNCSEHKPIKGCPRMCQTHHRWRQSQVSRRRHHPHCWSHQGQTALKQYGLNIHRKIPWYQHQQLLPRYSPWPPRICLHTVTYVPQHFINDTILHCSSPMAIYT